MTAPGKPTGMSDLLDALQATLASSAPERREAVGAAIDAYAIDFPEGFRWASGPQAPTFLHFLLSTIEHTCQPSSGSRASRARCLIDRKFYPRPYQTSGDSAHTQDAQSVTAALRPSPGLGQDGS
jgi:hypothetical protein